MKSQTSIFNSFHDSYLRFFKVCGQLVDDQVGVVKFFLCQSIGIGEPE